jgi:hypothetical protein
LLIKATTKMSQRWSSTLKERRFWLQASIKLRDYGIVKRENCFSNCKDIQTRSFLVPSTMRVILSLQVLRTIPVEFGGIGIRMRCDDDGLSLQFNYNL